MPTFLKNKPAFARLIACFVLLAYATRCTTMRPGTRNDSDAYAAKIEAGDTVRSIRNDMSTVDFKVSQLSDDGISGNNTFVGSSEIRQVDVKKIDAAKSGIVVAASVLVVGLLAYLSIDTSLGPISGSPGP